MTRQFASIKGKFIRPTVLRENERMQILKACKWADRVVLTPDYEPRVELLEELGADVILHGDDIVLDANHESIYTPFEKLGRFV